jgi:hypothetical protein
MNGYDRWIRKEEKVVACFVQYLHLCRNKRRKKNRSLNSCAISGREHERSYGVVETAERGRGLGVRSEVLN